jgi:hypothetical protein
MSTAEEDLLTALELHSVDGIRRALASDLDVGNPIQGKTPVNFLIELAVYKIR